MNQNNTQKGKMYVVGTPIGNLEDITFRAVRILKEVDVILAEDTRVTAKLTNRYEIDTPLLSYRDQNHQKALPKVIEILDIGQDTALVSDSGTPTISDPGYKLVSELLKDNYEIITIPGPSAIISALSISGLPTDSFLFLGFLPKSAKKREDILQKYASHTCTIVIYESPFRLLKLLNQISSSLGNRRVTLAKDMTKIHEDVITGKVNELIESLQDQKKIKGEYVVLVAKEGID